MMEKRQEGTANEDAVTLAMKEGSNITKRAPKATQIERARAPHQETMDKKFKKPTNLHTAGQQIKG